MSAGIEEVFENRRLPQESRWTTLLGTSPSAADRSDRNRALVHIAVLVAILAQAILARGYGVTTEVAVLPPQLSVIRAGVRNGTDAGASSADEHPDSSARAICRTRGSLRIRC